MKAPGLRSVAFSLGESHTDAAFLAPHHVAMLADIAGHDVQRDLVRYARQTSNLKGGAGPGHVANGAIDSGAVELDCSGLEYSLSWCCTSLGHSAALG
jgi:hypothetical protein